MIAVGTDIASYQLVEYLTNSPKFAPLYVLNEEPWHLRTYMFGAQLRYASGLLALVEKHQIKKVYRVTPEDYARLEFECTKELSVKDCELCLLSKGELPQD
ncbi:MAG: hypothetical protein GYB58_07120 [Gammaproteobacteria bacterium]|nr:hypothetical protein [Gammaproteobacteria bacterium]